MGLVEVFSKVDPKDIATGMRVWYYTIINRSEKLNTWNEAKEERSKIKMRLSIKKKGIKPP